MPDDVSPAVGIVMGSDSDWPKIRAAAVVPLVGHSGAIGTVSLATDDPRRFDTAGLELLVSLGQQIATGVEKFEVQYGEDTDADGSVDTYVDANSVTDWGEVIAVRYWLLTRAECKETGYTNGTTYTLAGVAYSPNDGYRRQLYGTTVMLRNR